MINIDLIIRKNFLFPNNTNFLYEKCTKFPNLEGQILKNIVNSQSEYQYISIPRFAQKHTLNTDRPCDRSEVSWPLIERYRSKRYVTSSRSIFVIVDSIWVLFSLVNTRSRWSCISNKHNKDLYQCKTCKMAKIEATCTECGKAFTRKSNLNRHKNQQHAERVKKIQCETCGKMVQNKSNFLTHTKRAHKKISGAAEKFSIIWVDRLEVSNIFFAYNDRYCSKWIRSWESHSIDLLRNLGF